MRNQFDDILDKMVEVLTRRIRANLSQIGRVKIRFQCINLLGKKQIVLWLWYPYIDKVHEGRKFTTDDDEARLSPLKVSEINLFGRIVADIASDDFEPEFIGFDKKDGKAEYSLRPKKMV